MSVCAPLPEWLVNLYALYSLEWEESDVEEDNVFDLCCAKCGVKLFARCYAYWDQSSNGIAGWRLRRASNTDHRVGTGYFVREGALLDEWLTAVEQVEARWP